MQFLLGSCSSAGNLFGSLFWGRKKLAKKEGEMQCQMHSLASNTTRGQSCCLLQLVFRIACWTGHDELGTWSIHSFPGRRGGASILIGIVRRPIDGGIAGWLLCRFRLLRSSTPELLWSIARLPVLTYIHLSICSADRRVCTMHCRGLIFGVVIKILV